MLKPRSKLGKYKIERRIAEGGFATVYRAKDTIEGVPVALKIPHPQFLTEASLAEFRKEVRLSATLDHPNILPIKNASYIDDLFVIAYPLGEETLADRLRRRASTRTLLSYADQALQAVAFAHKQRIIHCDIKPDNFILFKNDRLRLTDFGIAKIALQNRTVVSAVGTIGYIAPEQALGMPSLRSDVFSLGLLVYRMFSGTLPSWPYDWPPPGIDRLRANVHPDFVALIQKAIQVDERKRYADAGAMRSAFSRLKGRALRGRGRRKRRRRTADSRPNWKTMRLREFNRRYGSALQIRASCGRCGGPFSEFMQYCPWCGDRPTKYRGPVSFPLRCQRCGRGMKRDWRFCAFCYGAGVEPSTRSYSDVRYSARCSNPKCKRKELMPFMRYCPWCHIKTRKRWKIQGDGVRCRRCRWDVLPEYWSHCAWCGLRLKERGA